MNMKPFDVKSYIDFGVEQNNYAHLKLKVSDHVRISKHKDIFEKDFIPN